MLCLNKIALVFFTVTLGISQWITHMDLDLREKHLYLECMNNGNGHSLIIQMKTLLICNRFYLWQGISQRSTHCAMLVAFFPKYCYSVAAAVVVVGAFVCCVRSISSLYAPITI